jgi:hypothetical protein
MKKLLLFLLILFSIQSVNAEELDLYKHQINRYQGWEGLNDRTLDIAIKPTELSYIRNANYDNYPYITKREGYDKVNSYQISDDRIRGLFSFYRKNGTSFLVTATNRAIYKNTNGCQTRLKTGLSNLDVEYDATTFEDQLLITSDSDDLMTFGGVTISVIEGAPRGAYIEALAYRVWISGNCTFPSRLYFCSVLDETDWDSSTAFDDVADAGDAGYIDIEPNDGDRITGLAVLLDSLIIFKERSIYVLYNPSGNPTSDWSLKRVSADVGCVSNKSIANVKNELFFLSRKGVHSFSGATTEITYAFDQLKAFSLSDKIKGTFEDISQNQWDKACAISYDDKYWLAVPGSGSGYNNLILVYDFVVSAWTVYDGIYANYFTVYKESSEDELYFGDSRDYGFIYKYGGIYYDGALQEPATVQGTQSTSTLQDTTQSWTPDEFKGCRVNLYCGAGEGQIRTITSNTSNTLTVTPDWDTTPVSLTTLYCIGAIEFDVRTGFLPMTLAGSPLHDLDKQWFDAYIQSKAFGNSTYYLKLFFDIDQTGWSPAYTVDLNNDYDDYGTDLWGEASYAGKDLITKRVTFPRGAIGKYIKVKFYNYRPNERICIYNTVFTFDPLALQYSGVSE